MKSPTCKGFLLSCQTSIRVGQVAFLNLTSQTLACIYSLLITSGSTSEPDLHKYLCLITDMKSPTCKGFLLSCQTSIRVGQVAFLNLTSQTLACIYSLLITSGSTSEPDLRKFLFSCLHGKERGTACRGLRIDGPCAHPLISPTKIYVLVRLRFST